MSKDEQILDEFTSKEYEYGWTVDLEADEAPMGLNEDIVRFISAKKNEPQCGGNNPPTPPDGFTQPALTPAA